MGKKFMGVIGLGVMGRNLALNMAGKGFSVAAYDAWAEPVHTTRSAAGTLDLEAFEDLGAFMDALQTPRQILMMVKAGTVVDETIARLRPYLAEGDLLIDGGNSLFTDTVRRCRELAAENLLFVGAGVSGGEEGALNGPAIMPGGAPEAYERVAPVLEAIAAKVDGMPCCAYIGPDGAGHYVKMVHNGIEYGDMQLICEAWDLLRRAGGLSYKELADVFAEWNRGDLSSYLIEITADILTRTDSETGLPMTEIILDRAGMKGTGSWASQHALEIGAVIPTITEAVFARSLSARKEERVAASAVISGPPAPETLTPEQKKALVQAVGQALYASKIASYAQGFALMADASGEYGWKLDLGRIASLFRGGCIIRARFLDNIMEAYALNPDLSNLMVAPFFANRLNEAQTAWREAITAGVAAGIPMPAFTSALSYFDGYRSARLPASLLQAQRDYFGAHQFERVDREGHFHHNWIKDT